MGFVLGAAVAVVFAVLLAVAAWGDVRAYRIPNVLIAAFVALFVLALAGGVIPRQDIWRHLGAGVLALAIGLALFYRDWIGGGDAKLLAALALWTGWPDAIRLAIVMALAGGVVSIVVLLRNRRPGPFPVTGSSGESSPRRGVPYGVAIAIAGFDFWFRRLAVPAFFT